MYVLPLNRVVYFGDSSIRRNGLPNEKGLTVSVSSQNGGERHLQFINSNNENIITFFNEFNTNRAKIVSEHPLGLDFQVNAFTLLNFANIARINVTPTVVIVDGPYLTSSLLSPLPTMQGSYVINSTSTPIQIYQPDTFAYECQICFRLIMQNGNQYLVGCISASMTSDTIDLFPLSGNIAKDGMVYYTVDGSQTATYLTFYHERVNDVSYVCVAPGSLTPLTDCSLDVWTYEYVDME
jgi:hypothetical protein